MEEKEFKKIEKEFIKTPFGKRSKMISISPFIFSILFTTAFCIEGLILDDESFLKVHVIGWTISLIGGCITQSIYGILLNDYIKSRK